MNTSGGRLWERKVGEDTAPGNYDNAREVVIPSATFHPVSKVKHAPLEAFTSR